MTAFVFKQSFLGSTQVPCCNLLHAQHRDEVGALSCSQATVLACLRWSLRTHCAAFHASYLVTLNYRDLDRFLGIGQGLEVYMYSSNHTRSSHRQSAILATIKFSNLARNRRLGPNSYLCTQYTTTRPLSTHTLQSSALLLFKTSSMHTVRADNPLPHLHQLG